jgi:hypothetical protein
MATENEHIHLRGGQARRFRQLKHELEERLGYEPTKTRVAGHLLEHYEGPLLDDDD